tara:strand:- start:327 stop:1052 length:726 start_codon:yes stop_codon:yes gene_type:complete
MGTGTPGPIGSGADTAIRYQAELPEVMGRKLGLMDQAVKLAKGEQPVFQPTIPTQEVTPFTQMQQQAFDIGSQGVGSFQQYMNPYQDFVTQGIEDQFAKAENQQNLDAAAKGAYGGSRLEIANAELDRQRAQAVGQSNADAFNQAQGLRMADISNLMQLGGQQQQNLQMQADADYRQQLQQMYEPYQRLGFVSDIFQGAPTSASSLAMATTPQANPLAQAVGAGISGLAAYQGYKNLTSDG